MATLRETHSGLSPWTLCCSVVRITQAGRRRKGAEDGAGAAVEPAGLGQCISSLASSAS